METFFICIIIISAIFKTVGGQACTSSSYPILKMCYQDQKSNSTILMDFKHAEILQDTETCSCQIQVISGTSIALNQIKAYDHAYCGTQFEIKNVRFECRGSASVSVTDNETLSLKFKKVQYQKLSDYCYSLVITGGSSPNMVITCTGERVSTSTTTTSTSTSTTTTTTPPPTTTTSSTTTTTTKQPSTTTKAPTTTTTKPPTTTTKTTTTSTTASPPTTSSTTSTTKSQTTTTTTTTESPTTTTTTKTTTKSPTTTTKPSTTTSETTVSTTADTGTTDNTTTSPSTKAGEVTKTTTLATGEKTAASSTDEIPWMIVIPVIGVGAFLVLALIIVIVLLCQRRNKENGKNDSYEQPYIAHENQAMSLNDEKPYIENSDPKTDTSTFTTNVDEENNKNIAATNGDVKTDSDNINDLYATPQKNPKSDPDPEVTISTEVL